MTKLQYAQEYLGLFIEELRQYFPDKLIKACMFKYEEHKIHEEYDYYLGVDVARMGEDKSSFQIFIKKDNGDLIQVYNDSTSKTLLTFTAKEVIELDNKYNFIKILVDDGGLGAGVFDMLLENRQVRSKLIAINNLKRATEYDVHDKGSKSKIAKELIYEYMLMMMEQGKVKLIDDPDIFLSLKSAQYEYAKDDRGLSKIKIYGSHNDIREAIIRAVFGAKQKNYKPWVIAI